MSLFPTREIALQIGPLSVHWYGLMYLFAFLFIWWVFPRLQWHRNFHLSKDQIGTLLTYGIIGTLIGGRLGYVVFYAPDYYGDHPWEMFAIWRGGMSFHGGLVGVITALVLFSKQSAVRFWHLLDILVVPIAVGLAFGRVGNFINQELYGTITTLPWGIEVPGIWGARHPAQIYAVLKDLSIALICFLHLRSGTKAGTTTGLFLILYGVFRFLVEYVRMETATGLDVLSLHFTRGQLLTIPILIAGIIIYRKFATKRQG